MELGLYEKHQFWTLLYLDGATAKLKLIARYSLLAKKNGEYDPKTNRDQFSDSKNR
jgi:hypothetical protein